MRLELGERTGILYIRKIRERREACTESELEFAAGGAIIKGDGSFRFKRGSASSVLLPFLLLPLLYYIGLARLVLVAGIHSGLALVLCACVCAAFPLV